MTSEVVFNLYLKELGRGRYRLIMPNADGTLDGIPRPADGWAIRWPLNPHFTGERMIVALLKATPQYADCSIVYSRG